MPVMRGAAPVAMMTVLARMVRSPANSWRGIAVKSTLSTSTCSKRAPNLVACLRRLSISWKPYALGEPREVFHLAGGRELAAGQRALEDQRGEVGAPGVDGRG